MAQVTQDPQLQAEVEHFLTYALREWTAVPAYAAEFPTWGDTQQLAFVHEWAIREEALDLLHEHARRRVLTPEQRARYDRLLALVAEHRPTVERLIADD